MPSTPPHPLLERTQRRCVLCNHLNAFVGLWSAKEGGSLLHCVAANYGAITVLSLLMESIAMAMNQQDSVLSNSVSKGLLLVCGDRFVNMADRFFDALNVHNYSHGGNHSNSHIPPVQICA